MTGLRIGIDTGGTFTDVAALRRGRLAIDKVPSTPDDPARAVLDGLRRARRPGETVDVVHGTTVALNAVLTGSLARTAFVTNDGFLDLIEIGRQERSDLYNLVARKAQVPVPRRLRFTVGSRRSADGDLLARPRPAELRALRERLRRSRVEAVAIGLLHSYAHPEDEHAIAAALRTLGVPITCSADLLPVAGEFERFTAAILNAAVRPLVGRYLAGLEEAIEPGRLRLMRSSGGIMPGEEAALFPARAMFSGPAGGVLATRALCRRAGFAQAAALDMGGTSTDACLVHPQSAVRAGSIAGLPLALPSLEVHTVGCGGGSIARLDAGGALTVGPESAGADPGPACYGVGDEPTVTDAHVALGHLGADTLLSGEFPIDPDRAVRAIERLGARAGLAARQTAEGILEVARVHMMRALLVITVQRAVDPARVPLVAYGGAGGLHAAALRALLDMPEAVVPDHPGAFSAIGLAIAGESAEHVIPVLRPLDELDERALGRLARTAAEAVRSQLRGSAVRIRLTAGLRYAGQGPALAVPWRHPLARVTERTHEALFGFVPIDRALELVDVRARAEEPLRALPAARASGEAARPSSRRKPPVGGPALPVHARHALPHGTELAGPCVLEERTGATLVPRGSSCKIHPFGLVLRPMRRSTRD